jgi:glycosyltransferase involved in cell wall biosynthesis
VLHVAQSADYGLARFLGELLADQARRGWPVAFAGPQLDVDAAVELVPWEATRDPGRGVVDEARRLARIVDDVAPDVVHLHSSKAGLAGRLVLRGRRPTLFQPHAWSFLAVSGLARRAAVLWERWAARWADVVVCCSEAERRQGERARIRARWRVVSNAVDLSRLPPDDDASRDPRLVVCVGRLWRQKGQDVLLDAWPSVRARVPDACLVLVGDGPDREPLAARAAHLDAVELVGCQADAVPWLRRAAVVAQPSRYEGLSLTVLEAMAAGRSIVATDVEGLAEAIGPGGAIVPTEDPAALADAIVHRLRDPELAASEGRAGRERAARSHDLRGWGDRMAELTLSLVRP